MSDREYVKFHTLKECIRMSPFLPREVQWEEPESDQHGASSTQPPLSPEDYARIEHFRAGVPGYKKK